MYWAIGIVFLFLILTLCWWIKFKLSYTNICISDFNIHIESLSLSAADGGLLFFSHRRSKQFIQFAIYRPEKSPPVLHFSFPDAKWSHGLFSDVKLAVENANFTAVTTPTDNDFVPQFLEVNIEIHTDKDINQGSILARVALEAMGFFPEDKFDVKYKTQLAPEYAIATHQKLADLDNGRIGRWANRQAQKIINNR